MTTEFYCHVLVKESRENVYLVLFFLVNYMSYQLKFPAINLKPIWISTNARLILLLVHLAPIQCLGSRGSRTI